jgi:hypothetical protein
MTNIYTIYDINLFIVIDHIKIFSTLYFNHLVDYSEKVKILSDYNKEKSYFDVFKVYS